MEKTLIEKYVGKLVQLFPGDSYWKKAKIVDIDDLGWTFEVVDVEKGAPAYWEKGKRLFYTHAYNLDFKIIG